MTYTVGHVYTIPSLTDNGLREHPLYCYDCYILRRGSALNILRDLVPVYPGDTLLCLEVNSDRSSNHFHTQSAKIVRLLDDEFVYRVVELVEVGQNV